MKIFATLIVFVLVCSIDLKAGTPSADNTIYDSDTNHLWNRLNETLFERMAQDGKKYGSDELDILYWAGTTNLLAGTSHQQALSILDEFIKTHGEKLIRDPLKRVLLQRDLWELFDWSASPGFFRGQFLGERHELQSRLAAAIRRVALSTNEIALLPDNYAQAETNLDLTNLPQGLFQTNGDWMNAGIKGGNPAAMAHVRYFGGRSTFFVMFKRPDGRQAAIDYLSRLRSFAPMWVYFTNSASQQTTPITNPNLPQFPTNSQWALVRRMNVIDTEGRIQPTQIIESVQLRTFLDLQRIYDVRQPNPPQRFDEFDMSRKSNMTLARIPKDGKAFLQFFSIGMDPFELHDRGNEDRDSATYQHEVFETCAQCHARKGIHSVNTFSRFFSAEPSFQTIQIADMNTESETMMTAEWKQQQFDWGLLQGLWLQEN